MRRIVLLVIISMLYVSAFSQEPQENKTRYYRHEISANVGIGSLSGNRWDTFRKQMEERFGLSFRHGYAHYTVPLGVRMGLRYTYFLNRHIAIGCQYSYFVGSLEYDHYSKEERVEIAPNAFSVENREYDNPQSIRAKSFSVMPAVKWLYSRHFYVRGGIGFQYREYSLNASTIDASVSSPIYDRQWLFAYQFVPLGMEFTLPGDELSTLIFKKVSPIYFHAELGYGMEGILNIGLAYKFGESQ